MKMDHLLFEKTLRAKEITKKAFSEYAKIPYYTVAGWKKAGKVPTYAMVIARDMIYRKMLDDKAKNQMKRSLKNILHIVPDLLPTEKKRIEAAFWGTNYTAEEIVQKVLDGDRKFIKQFNENVPKKLQNKIIATGEPMSAGPKFQCNQTEATQGNDEF